MHWYCYFSAQTCIFRHILRVYSYRDEKSVTIHMIMKWSYNKGDFRVMDLPCILSLEPILKTLDWNNMVQGLADTSVMP